MATTKIDAQDVVYPSEEVARCPFPFFAALREDAPVHLVPGRDEYLVSRYEDIIHVLRRPEIFSSVTYVLDDGARRKATLEDMAVRDPNSVATFQASDPPAHTWKRKLASAHFRPGQVRTYEPIIRRIVGELIDGFAGQGRCEFISRFARPLGARTTMLIVGLPVDDARHAEDWSKYDGQGTPYHKPERQAAIAQQVREMHEYIEAALGERLERPREDVLTAFLQSHVERNGRELGLQHAIMDTFSVMLGGVGTSSHMLGNTMRLLLEHPDGLAKAREDPEVLAGAIEEALRLESPVQWNLRLCREDTEIGGVPVQAGRLVLLLYSSANRDPDHFPSAEEFDAQRGNVRQHLAFGHGLHFCLGAPLARLQAQIAFEALLQRFPEIRFAEGTEPVRVDSLAFRGLERLDLEFTAA